MGTVDKLLDKPELLGAMLDMPRSMNMGMVTERRKELFSFLWEHGGMERVEAMNMVNQRELDFVRKYEHYEIPEWLLRMEAQDVLLEVMYERLEEEGLA